ncbi:ABC transporter, ATP-binding protein [Apilactobacillus kunkeei EFB6]|uniref:ABC transporter, ATP-binding protein n=1 Tax=Apilactobacillus kunkeei EFB6 TaxID=1419324 RepID=A0A836YUD7_9LACO|nr:ABC transporter ATP-binding protein [Apilactobacillus kunkeei]KDB00408.1 ABC transporter, ATP-binding protein [Apilactobacillus kunkeei EFB6]
MTKSVEINNLNKKIGKKLILNDISFEINQGDIVGLVGENGAGKTTIMKTILGMIEPTSGSITINGKEVTISKRNGLKGVGSLIENPVLYPYLSGMQHLQLFSETKNNGMINYLVNQLNMQNYINKNAVNYSLGMKQKLAIAMALVNQPSFAILDEPVNGLDPKSTKEVRDLIVDLNKKGTTFLISSHILAELEKIINRVVIIKKGSKIFDNYLEYFGNKVNKVVVKTSNNKDASDILKNNGIEVDLSNDELTIIGDFKLQTVIDLINGKQISFESIQTINDDFEDDLIQILDEK